MTDRDDLVLAELRLMREHISALVSELRSQKRKAARRVKTIAKRLGKLDEDLGGHKPTALEVARARRMLRR